MGKARPLNLFKNRGLMKRLNSAFIIAAVIAILFLVNIIADMLPWSYDMTEDKIFTLSEYTRKVLADIESNVNIIAFFEEGAENAMIKTLLEEYKKTGKGKLKVEYMDADKNPAAVKKYDVKNEGIQNGTIVFECNGKIKKVSRFDIEIFTDFVLGKAFNGEQQFTGAIIHVTSGKLPKIYFLEGHMEPGMDESLSKLKARIEGEAHVVETLNMLKSGAVPDDADAVVVVSPKKDLNEDEKAKLKNYLEKGGRAVFLFDILAQDDSLPNFNNLLKDYGVQIRNNFVVEEDGDSFYGNNKMYLIPYYTRHSIVEKLGSQRLYVLFPFSSNIDIMEETDRTVTVEALIITSDKSWSRYDIQDATPEKTDKDEQGPATLAVAAVKDNTDMRYDETKIVAVGNSRFIDNDHIDVQGNFSFFMNSLNWVEDRDESIAIRPKMLNTNTMFVKGVLYIALLVVSILVIPMLAFLAGFTVWIKRRHL